MDPPVVDATADLVVAADAAETEVETAAATEDRAESVRLAPTTSNTEQHN